MRHPSATAGRPVPLRSAIRPGAGNAVRAVLLRLVLVLVAATGLALLVPGTASAAGETIVGTLQTGRSGPIEGIEVTVTTADGDEVDTEDRQAHGELTAVPTANGRIRAGQHGQDDPVRRVGEQAAEAGRGRGPGGLTGQHPLGVRLGAVLAHQREDGGQVVGSRRARDDAGPLAGS